MTATIGPARVVRFTSDGRRDYVAFKVRAPATASEGLVKFRRAAKAGLRTAVTSPLDPDTWYWAGDSAPANRVGFLFRVDNTTAWVFAVLDTRQVLRLPMRP